MMELSNRRAATNPVLTIMILACLWLAGAGSGFAADAPLVDQRRGHEPGRVGADHDADAERERLRPRNDLLHPLPRFPRQARPARREHST